MNAVERYRTSGHSLGKVSRELDIPPKNIRRWMRDGPERKKGAGKKVRDPEMEEELMDWLQQQRRNGYEPTKAQIQEKAKTLSKDEKFKGSKGWLQKFFERSKRRDDQNGRDDHHQDPEHDFGLC